MALIPSYVKNKFTADNMQCFGDLVTDTLEANTLTITNLNVDTLNATTVNATTVSSTTVNSSNGTISNFNSDLMTTINIDANQYTYLDALNAPRISQQVTVITLEPEDIKTDLKNFPVAINTAPPSGQFTWPVAIYFSYKYATAAYSNLTNISYGLIYHNGSTGDSSPLLAVMPATGLLDATQSQFAAIVETQVNAPVFFEAAYAGANSTLFLKQVGSSNLIPTNGGGTLTITVVYNYVVLGL